MSDKYKKLILFISFFIVKMLFKRFILFFKMSTNNPVVLGRWGYHWEKKILYNKYYD